MKRQVRVVILGFLILSSTSPLSSAFPPSGFRPPGRPRPFAGGGSSSKPMLREAAESIGYAVYQRPLTTVEARASLALLGHINRLSHLSELEKEMVYEHVVPKAKVLLEDGKYINVLYIVNDALKGLGLYKRGRKHVSLEQDIPAPRENSSAKEFEDDGIRAFLGARPSDQADQIYLLADKSNKLAHALEIAGSLNCGKEVHDSILKRHAELESAANARAKETVMNRIYKGAERLRVFVKNEYVSIVATAILLCVVGSGVIWLEHKWGDLSGSAKVAADPYFDTPDFRKISNMLPKQKDRRFSVDSQGQVEIVCRRA